MLNVPTVGSWGQFLALLFPAYLFGVAFHELGHLLAGRLVRLDVAACGIGYRRPFMWRTWRGVTFFAGFPLTAGVTITAIDRIRFPRRQLLCMVLGGPIATISVLIGSWLIWSGGWESDPIAAIWWTALPTAVIVAIPLITRHGPVSLANDAALAWHLLRGGSLVSLISPGAALATADDLAATCQRIGCDRGRKAFLLAGAAQRCELGDGQGALLLLDKLAAAAAVDTDWGHDLARVVRALALVASESPDADTVLGELQHTPPKDDDLKAAVLLARLERALEVGQPSAKLVEVVRTAVQSTGDLALVASAEALEVLAAPLEERLDSARRLLERKGRNKLNPILRLRLSSDIAAELAERGDTTDAEDWFRKASAEQASIAAGITDANVRSRFLLASSKPLRRALIAAPEIVPALFAFQQIAVERPSRARRSFMPMTAAAAGLLSITITAYMNHDMAVLGWTAPSALFVGIYGLFLSGWVALKDKTARSMAFAAVLLNLFLLSASVWFAGEAKPGATRLPLEVQLSLFRKRTSENATELAELCLVEAQKNEAEGSLSRARQFYQRALHLYQTGYGSLDRQASALRRLAKLLDQMGDKEKSQQYQARASEIERIMQAKR